MLFLYFVATFNVGCRISIRSKLKKRIEELFQLFTKIMVYFDLTNRNSRLRWRI